MTNIATALAGFQTEGTFVPDSLRAGDFPVRGRKVTILSGQNLARGALIGAITRGALTAVGAAGVPAPAAATITGSPVAAGAAVGVHRFVCVVGGSAIASKWNHVSPSGAILGQASGNTAYTGGGLTLTITDAGTDPVVGETFTVTVTAAAASGKYVLSLAAATDGSQVPIAILAEDVNATSADAEGMALISGDFNEDAIVFGTGHTAASTREGLRDISIFLHNPVLA